MQFAAAAEALRAATAVNAKQQKEQAQADREAEPRTLADRIEWERDHERELRK